MMVSTENQENNLRSENLISIANRTRTRQTEREN